MCGSMSEVSSTTGSRAAPDAGADGAGGIGRRLAAHRARRGLRVAELAREVGVTPSLISQIERGQSRPSVSTLFALAQALHVPVDAFFRESPQVSAEPEGERAVTPPRGRADADGGPRVPEPRDSGAEALPYDAPRADGRYLVRKETRATIDIEGGVRWERLTRNTMDHLDFFELVYEPGAESHPRQYTHPGTEMLLVMRGKLEITVGFERYLLGPGDSIDFPSSMPHRYVNHGTETVHAVTVIFYDCPDKRDGIPGDGRPAP